MINIGALNHVGSYPRHTRWTHLLHQDLKRALDPCSGRSSTDVNPLDLQNLMECYKSDPGEWAKYAYRDPSRGYTRNLVDNGNGKSNLVRRIRRGRCAKTEYRGLF